MQSISFYRFTTQQESEALRLQKFDFFYPKFLSKFNELSLTIQKWQKVAKKCLKFKKSTKPRICRIRCLRVNSQVKNLWRVPKESPFVIFWFCLTLQCKKIVDKSVSGSNFSSVKPLEHTLFFKIFEKTQPISFYRFTTQKQSGTSRLQKFDLFYPKFIPKFNDFSRKIYKWQEVVRKCLKLK